MLKKAVSVVLLVFGVLIAVLYIQLAHFAGLGKLFVSEGFAATCAAALYFAGPLMAAAFISLGLGLFVWSASDAAKKRVHLLVIACLVLAVAVYFIVRLL